MDWPENLSSYNMDWPENLSSYNMDWPEKCLSLLSDELARIKFSLLNTSDCLVRMCQYSTLEMAAIIDFYRLPFSGQHNSFLPNHRLVW